MLAEITDKTFYKQLTGSYAGALTASTIAGVIVGFCAIFCGTQLGWLHLLTIIFLVGLLLCLFLIIRFILKAAGMKKHPVFQRYGNAAMLAGIITDGMAHPRYFAQGFDSNLPFATLMTDQFIVSGAELVSYMELRDLRSAQPASFGTTNVVYVGNPLMTAGSIAANYAGDKILESKGINAQTKFDLILMKDAEGKEHQYSIRHADMDSFLNLLREVAPHIRIDYNVKQY